MWPSMTWPLAFPAPFLIIQKLSVPIMLNILKLSEHPCYHSFRPWHVFIAPSSWNSHPSPYPTWVAPSHPSRLNSRISFLWPYGHRNEHSFMHRLYCLIRTCLFTCLSFFPYIVISSRTENMYYSPLYLKNSTKIWMLIGVLETNEEKTSKSQKRRIWDLALSICHQFGLKYILIKKFFFKSKESMVLKTWESDENWKWAMGSSHQEIIGNLSKTRWFNGMRSGWELRK